MNKQLLHSDVFQLIEKWAPKKLAYEWDNVGLQVGSYNKVVKKIMITLDVLESVVDEAIREGVNLIIAHHPLLFKSLKQLNADTPQGRIISKLIQHDITVYAAHTNLDIANGGVNDILCNLLGIKDTSVLVESESKNLYKIAVYVPKTHTKIVQDVLSENGAGHIGNYSHCSFQTEGKRAFKPLEGTNPHIGTRHELAHVDEVRIETIVKEENLNDAISKMIEKHPYEEPAYDIFPLKNKGEKMGVGRIGSLASSTTLIDLCEHVKNRTEMNHVRVTGDLEKTVKKVAVLGGSGEKYIHLAKRKGADVYITGDMSFHVAQDAWAAGLAVIDAGHYIEKVMKEATKSYLDTMLKDKATIEVVTSKMNTDPFQFI
ncbi:Nif3-like dinuclear metal center hexameric protein [Oceanobacillus bengalensis]|uniref:GTP cyclohydrolase 1 type 2 homolog n=1 Tax=Oceanobacillus bengalensis TaxID=1435466 RepID=A0A494Z5R9_9BACI|nr:Nif3-like dinuclear metal center hexameric protein [Oceanobacillus bengalensis]RKQ17834.1 Nif3-like dinuclear metal center hexameric protein [Oceanobacillus bengalensis]